MKQLIFGFILAVQFLTRIPVPVSCPWNKNTSRWAIRSYPLVGIILGFILAVLLYFVAPYLPLGMLALFTVSVCVWLTGGLHLDGWMDVADAIGSNAPLERKWEIMKDPVVGSFGHIALLFLLAWKTIFIYSLFESDLPIYSFIFIFAFSRLGAVVLLIALPAAKKQGLAWEWRKNVNKLDGLYAAIPVIGIVWLFPDFLYLIPSYIVFIVFLGIWVKVKFKGINGDLLGTAIEGGELWGLAITWIYILFVIA
ncbi:adenosylcobinamide-GDP ribazoletransferase [Virgibacillus sediminis]|uniref:Adenosylcobinamide-GDP ribazoletransferase n=1 Tax=Virgibacillus sediminis TaxID=202260 RepID=A0ABV7A7Y4_9BACI